MRQLLILLLTTALFTVNDPVCIAQTTKQVDIVLTQPWTSTGLQVVSGEKFTVSSSGIMNWYTGQCGGKCVATPDGSPCTYAGFPYPQFACWSLIGKIGEQGMPFQVGSKFSGVAAVSGELFLGVNDNNYPDNTGNWKATIEGTDPCPDAAREGDVVIYWKNGQIQHSGYVTRMDGCKVVGFDCYSIPFHKVMEGVNPDSSIFLDYGNWTVYHTDRKDQRIIATEFITQAGQLRFFGITDEKNLIVTVPVFGINCHGYTFIPSNFYIDYSIVGYEFPQDKIEHNDATKVDQGTAVQFILRDNAYHQVHAEGPDSMAHFTPDYEVAAFAVRLPEPQKK
jgi:hypothetical protein